jgi:hypothetical protein
VEGIDGQPVPTSASFLSFLTWFENTIQAKGDDVTVIDATEGGAKIHGAHIMTFREAIDLYCQEDIGTERILVEVIEDYKPLPDEKMLSIIKELEETAEVLRDIKRLSRNGVRLSDKLLAVYKDGKAHDVDRILKKLDDIDIRIKEEKERLSILASILELVTFKVMEGFHEKEDEDLREMGMRIAKRSKALYEGFEATIAHSLPYLEGCVDKIKTMYSLDDQEMDICQY